MGLATKSINKLREALPCGTIIKIVIRDGHRVQDYINSKGWSISLHGKDGIHFFSPHTRRHIGEINYSNYDTCSVSKTNIKLDNCIIAIKKRGVI